MTQIKTSRAKSRKEPLVEAFNGTEETENPLEKKETKPERRAARVPLGGVRRKLDVKDKDPNYAYRVFNDVGGRIERAKAAWWEPVNDEQGQVDRRVVGKDSNGKPIYGQVMRIKKELFEEDQKAKQAPIDEMEEQLRGGYVAGGIDRSQNAYVPSSGIKIERK